MTHFAYLFSPSGLNVVPSIGDLSNVVYSVDYRIAAVGENHQAYAKLTTVLPAPSPDNFVDYGQITEAQLIGWLENTEPTLEAVKADLAQTVQEMEETPQTVNMPLPWQMVQDVVA